MEGGVSLPVKPIWCLGFDFIRNILHHEIGMPEGLAQLNEDISMAEEVLHGQHGAKADNLLRREIRLGQKIQKFKGGPVRDPGINGEIAVRFPMDIERGIHIDMPGSGGEKEKPEKVVISPVVFERVALPEIRNRQAVQHDLARRDNLGPDIAEGIKIPDKTFSGFGPVKFIALPVTDENGIADEDFS